ncbi:MAG: hypothetical protein DRP82_01960 [Planctomycetota bacterium]|nr:MAG: hypothetical protein DRP82_01960 [Planctomycetota bacterium]
MNLTKEQLRIGRLLLAEGPITSDFVEEQIRKEGKESVLAKAVKACGHVSESLLVRALLASYRIPRVRLEKYSIPDEALKLLTASDARRFRVIPLGKVGAITCLAVESVLKFDLHAVHQLRRILGGPVKLFQADPQEIEQMLDKHYPPPKKEVVKAIPLSTVPNRKRLIPIEHSFGWWRSVHTREGPVKAVVMEMI